MERQEAMKEALETVKAQASVRTMSEDEIVSMVGNLAHGIQVAAGTMPVPEAEQPAPAINPKKAITESGVVCLECGRKFKILTKKHLATHGLTPEEYRAKYGYKKTQALACKALSRERRKKMASMELWTRRGKTETQAQQ